MATITIAPEILRTFLTSLFIAEGVDPLPADAISRNMVWSELAGRSNYGLERVPIHVRRLRAGVMSGADATTIHELGPSLVRVDGGGGPGQYAAERAMAAAVDRSRETGIGIAGVRASNSFGPAAYYLCQAAEAGMISMVFGNSFPKVAAHGGRLPVFGTNPMAFGAPRRNGEHILIDMATSALSGSTVTQVGNEGHELPAGIAIDSEGRPATSHKNVTALLPFGGAKGFGLSLMVEILAGVLTGAGLTKGVASIFSDFTRNGNNGHFMVVINVGRWLPIELFSERLEILVDEIRASGDGVRIPGETRWESIRRLTREGIPVVHGTWRQIAALASESGLVPPKLAA